jgi:hypothetical protein
MEPKKTEQYFFQFVGTIRVREKKLQIFFFSSTFNKDGAKIKKNNLFFSLQGSAAFSDLELFSCKTFFWFRKIEILFSRQDKRTKKPSTYTKNNHVRFRRLRSLPHH